VELPSLDAETSAVGRNTEFNEVVKCVVIVIKIKFNGCRVSNYVGCLNCVGCRVAERCVGCLHCVVLGIGISI